MAKPQESSRIPSCDDYFEGIQSRKKIPYKLQESLTEAFAKIPVSSFPEVPGGKVIEIASDASIADAVRILSGHNITSAPVTAPEALNSTDWKERYLGIIDYSAIILWVLENAELAATALSAGTATAAGVGAGAVGALGALALGATGPAAVAGLAVAAVGAAVVGGVAIEKGMGKDAPTAADNLGDDFYNVLLKEEPFKSTPVGSIVKSFRWAPFLPVTPDSSMLSVLLLLSKYRLRNIPVVEMGKPTIKNFITQSAVVKGLEQCKGRDWFDCIAAHPIYDLGLPFMTYEEQMTSGSCWVRPGNISGELSYVYYHQVICVKSDDLVLEAFKHMKDNKIGGVPVVEEPGRKIVGNLTIKDIRFLLLQPDLFSNFRQLTVMDFMRIISSTNQDDGVKVFPPITCTLEVNLGSVIETLSSKSVQRVYVVGSSENEVVGVITLRDVISCFIFEPPHHFDNYFGSAMEEMLTN